MIKNLDKVTLLIVEDNDQVRTLITSILRCIGIGEVLKARDGGEAIEILKSYPLDHRSASGCGIDLILCDWFMSPVDGISLLRWVRQHPESPNPFIPFIMISAVCDAAKIERARDLGASGFLAKPFSVEAITAHLHNLLTTDNIFIHSPNFFGPDRRRKYIENYEVNRRSKDDQPEKVKKYRLLSILPQKSKKQIHVTPDKFPVIDRQIMRDVKKELSKQTQGFLDAVLKYIALLEKDCLSTTNIEDPKRKPFFKRMNSIAHELRGLGGIFEYPLVAIIAQSLYDLTSIYDLSDDCLGLIKDHIDSFKAVIRGKIKGMGGDIGRELIDALDAANQRFTHRHDQKFIYK